MRPLSRRALAGALAGLLLAAAALPALAGDRTITDATGRELSVPDDPARVFAAGPPAAGGQIVSASPRARACGATSASAAASTSASATSAVS